MSRSITSVLRSSILAVWVGINVLVVLCTLLAAYGGYIPPRVFPLTQLANMTFGGWVILSAILLAINFIAVKRLTVMFGITLLLCAGPLLTIFPVNFNFGSLTPEEKETEFSVLTYNVLGFRDNEGASPSWGNRTLSYIINSGADIVCLQEAAPLHGPGAYGNKAQRDSIAAIYPYYTEQPDRAGETLLSKYPFEVIDTPQPDWGSGHYTAYEVNIDGHATTVINCHLQSIGLTPDDKELYRDLTDKDMRPTKSELTKVKNDLIGKLSNAFITRAEQAQSIKDFLSGQRDNVILVGDFNDVPGSYAYRTIKSCGLRDAYSDCAFGPVITYNTNRFYFRIDHILYRGNLKAIDIRRGDIRSSDHYPLTATFIRDNKE